MNSNKLILTFSLLFALFITACNKKLDVTPQQSVDATTAITTPQDVKAAVIGAYSIMGGGALYGTNLFLIPDLYAANSSAPAAYVNRYATWLGTFTGQRQVYQKSSLTRDNAEASRTWIAAYQAINAANIVLESLNIVTDATDKSTYEGEALFIRGIMHFELVRLYALPWGAVANNTQKGIVIKTKATKTEAAASVALPRNTVAEVYQQVIADLTAAVGKLPSTNGTRATKYTALAFLSRVYLQQGDYVKALDAANQVINSNIYKLNASVTAVFSNKNTLESIWEIQQNDQNNAGTSNDGMATFYASLPGVGRADVRVSTGFVDTLYPAGDLRKTEWYYIAPDAGARPGTFTSKWKSFNQNLPVIRLAELYLTRAECNIRLNSAVGATSAADLAQVKNSIRTNSIATAAPLLADVLAERVLETAFEGLRIHDVKRLRQSVGSFAWNADRLVLPIPQREIDASRGIIE
jgi:starch-binding outer membrane protein, SusD/RagB family